MSSHHIVRDEQEPALILDQIENFPVEHLHNLLEWSPTVAVCEPELQRYTSLGHKVDLALVHAERFLYWQQELENQQPVKIIAIGDSEFLETALTILQRNQHHSVNVVTGENELPGVMKKLEKWSLLLNLVVFTPVRKYLIHQGDFIKWLPAMSLIYLLPLSRASIVSTTGFEENVNIELHAARTFRRTQEGEVQIRSTLPIIIAEDL